MAEPVTRDWRRRKASSSSTTRIEHHIPPELAEWVQVTTERITELQQRVHELETADLRRRQELAANVASIVAGRAA